MIFVNKEWSLPSKRRLSYSRISIIPRLFNISVSPSFYVAGEELTICAGFEETISHLSIFLEYVPGGSVGRIVRKHGKVRRLLSFCCAPADSRIAV